MFSQGKYNNIKSNIFNMDAHFSRNTSIHWILINVISSALNFIASKRTTTKLDVKQIYKWNPESSNTDKIVHYVLDYDPLSFYRIVTFVWKLISQRLPQQITKAGPNLNRRVSCKLGTCRAKILKCWNELLMASYTFNSWNKKLCLFLCYLYQ
jgi:hypothetical protein